jgi:hypothetical protein
MEMSIREYVYLAIAAACISIAAGAWLGFVNHSTHMSLVKSINAERSAK